MTPDNLVYGLTRPHPPDAVQVQRQQTRLFALFVVAFLVLAVAPLFFPVSNFWNAWQHDSWGDYWHEFFPTNITLMFSGLLVLSPLLDSLRTYAEKRELAVHLRTLRQRAAAGDNSWAPLAQPQVEPLADTDLPIGPTPWGVFHSPVELTRKVVLVLGIVGSFILAPFAGLLLILFWTSADPDPGRLITGSITVLLVGIGVLVLRRSRQLSRGIAVIANAESLEWKQWHWWASQRQQVAWQEARAFYTFTYENNVGGHSQRRAIYALDADGATFAWMLSPSPSEHELEAHDRLASLIVARTHLPLRTLEPGTRAAKQEIQEETRLAKSRRARGDIRSSTSTPVFPMKQRLRYRGRLMLVPLALFGLLSGVAWGAQTYESYTYGQLLAQVRAHTPIFADALTTPDGYWPVIQPTATNPDSATFTDGAYQLSGGACFWAWPSFTIGNAAVDVTVHLRGSNQTLDNVWAGLVLHMDDQGNGLLFEVNPAGYWTIGTLDTFDFHESGAIQVNPNKLTVMMRGSDYLFFVNDQFVGTYHDTRFSAGHVGIYLGSADTVLAFSNFVVYPV